MHNTLRRAVPRFLPLAFAALLPGCKGVDVVPKVPGITPYRMVIQQGNFISQEMVSQLKPGMTKEQVRFILGTPLVNDIFHADRWDYVFFRETADGKREQRNLSVVFEKDKLARVLGDLLPSDGTAAPQSSGFNPLVKPEAAPAQPAAKPAAQPAEAPKPAAAAPLAETQPAAAPAPEARPADAAPPAPAPKEAAAPKAEKEKSAEEDKERGFFGRMLEKIGL